MISSYVTLHNELRDGARSEYWRRYTANYWSANVYRVTHESRSRYSLYHDSPFATHNRACARGYGDCLKKTVYEYLRKLEQAGLISKTDEESSPSSYEAEDFELQLTIRSVEVSITPELVEVVAHVDDYPVIARVRDDHGLVTFALAHDLIKSHSEGEITVRQIADLTELSHGTTYDLLEALYEIHDLSDTDSSPTTYTPADVVDEDDDLLTELTDQ